MFHLLEPDVDILFCLDTLLTQTILAREGDSLSSREGVFASIIGELRMKWAENWGGHKKMLPCTSEAFLMESVA